MQRGLRFAHAARLACHAPEAEQIAGGLGRENVTSRLSCPRTAHASPARPRRPAPRRFYSCWIQPWGPGLTPGTPTSA
jgi:hypothetical protein